MTQTWIANYVNGVFKPETPVDLPENAKVELEIRVLPATHEKPGSILASQANPQELQDPKFSANQPRSTRDEPNGDCLDIPR